VVPDDRPQKPLTVAHVIHSLGAGGAEALLVELARVAPSVGMRLVVIALSEARSGYTDNRVVAQLRELGVSVYEMNAGRYDLPAIVRLARLLRDEQAQVVHTHLKHADVVGGLAARLIGVPSVSTLHTIDIATTRMHQLRVRAAVLARRYLSSTVIALSAAQRQWYSEYAGVGAPVILLPNGIADPVITREPVAVRAEIGAPEDGLLAVCASLFSPVKGHADLLEAVRLLPDDLPLVVALAGDGALLAEVQATVNADPALRQRIRILGFRRDVPDLIAASDFVIQPSLRDALPTVLISALAGARPIVGTAVGGIPDIVGPGCGLLVEAGNPAALRAGIMEMATTLRGDPAAVAAMHQATRERYESHFSAEVWIRNLRALYERVIGSPERRRIALVEFPTGGGLYQFSLQLGEGLARAGDDVELITGPSPEIGSREPGCRVRSILPTWHPKAGAGVPEWWRRSRRAVRAARLTAAWAVLIGYLLRRRPDVVMWSEWRFPVDGLGVHLVRKVLPHSVLALVAHEPRPLVEQPGQAGLYKTSPAMQRSLTRAFADLDVVFVLGESARQTLIETWPVTGSVHVIPHGDEAIFATSAIPGAEATRPVVLAFGGITAYKGIDTLCRVWPAVRAQVPDAELVIVGSVAADVDEAQLRSQVAELPGAVLHIGYVPIPDVAPYFAQARCVALPYKRSSQSGVAHLAHTMRRPVVATRVGDIPAVVRDGVSGVLVEPDDEVALVQALVRLLTDPDLAKSMGEAGAQHLAQEASWDDVAARVRDGLPAPR
jgi:glycosyltransferase involved in cell wall biosynthesis